jgi:hypothetical protein
LKLALKMNSIQIKNFFFLILGITFELNELKKKHDAIEEELKKIKKTHGNEVSELHQYYEQRVSNLI